MARKKDEALTEARKNEILDAAAVCFVRYGIHQASMRQICAQSGLSTGAVYNYFKSKDDIIEAMAERVRDEIHELEAYLNANKNPYKAILQASQWMIEETSLTEAKLDIEVAAEAARNEAVFRHIKRTEVSISDCFEATVKRGQENGTITKERSAEELAQLIITIYDGFAGRIAFDGEKHKKQMARLTKYALSKLLKP